jgi:hypothetical protein
MINIKHTQNYLKGWYDFILQQKIILFAEKQLISEGISFLGCVINILGNSVPEITKVKTRITKVSMEQINETL